MDWGNAFLWAQALGLIALSINITAWQLENSRHIIMCHIPARILMAIQYIMLGAPLGAIMDICAVFRDTGITFSQDKFSRYIILICLFSSWVVGLYFSESWYDALPMIAVTIGNIALLYREDRSLYARMVIIASFFFIIYNIMVGSWMGLACGILVIVSSIIGMYRYEGWNLGKCYRSFLPNFARSLLVFPNFRTYL